MTVKGQYLNGKIDRTYYVNGEAYTEDSFLGLFGPEGGARLEGTFDSITHTVLNHFF